MSGDQQPVYCLSNQRKLLPAGETEDGRLKCKKPSAKSIRQFLATEAKLPFSDKAVGATSRNYQIHLNRRSEDQDPLQSHLFLNR